jgi:hypothetical protein
MKSLHLFLSIDYQIYHSTKNELPLRFVIPLLFKHNRTILYICQLLMKNTIRYTDGAPVHFWLNDKFDNRWIGRGGAISWAPGSPDMVPLEFFLWGHIKNQHLQD